MTETSRGSWLPDPKPPLRRQYVSEPDYQAEVAERARRMKSLAALFIWLANVGSGAFGVLCVADGGMSIAAAVAAGVIVWCCAMSLVLVVVTLLWCNV